MTPAPAIGPITLSERTYALDVIRGFALLGILVMNMPGFSSSFHIGWNGTDVWPEWWNQATLRLRDVLFDGKFNSMFSFLFAVGFTIQLQRLEQRVANRAWLIYVRRLIALLVFGVAHACLLWSGDVLHMYALLGFLLLLIRGWSDRSLIILIVLCVLYPSIATAVRMSTRTTQEIETIIAISQARASSNDLAFGLGSFIDAARESTSEMLFAYTNRLATGTTISFYAMIFATMVLGLLVGKHRWLQRAHQFPRQLRAVQGVTLVIGLLSGIAYTKLIDFTAPFDRSPLTVALTLAYGISRISLMLFYVATLTRLTLNERWRRILEPLAAAGRMALTNYLLQSLLGTFIFYGWGLGLWNQVSWSAQFALAFVIFFGLQIPLSYWWLSRHEYGPMEYLWRWLTYAGLAVNARTKQQAEIN